MRRWFDLPATVRVAVPQKVADSENPICRRAGQYESGRVESDDSDAILAAHRDR
jgi:hypothetical protein